MQCFQKDPNLRVSARKLLKHPWIVNARRSDSVVPKKPTEYDEAVKSVQQWNEALKSPNAGSLRRTSRPMSSSPIPGRRDQTPVLAKPAKGSLNLAKPRIQTDQFRSPESTADDNWDDDFASAISPSALQLPHLRPQDNFGGLLSSEKLKAYASFETVTEETNWDDNFEGDLTVKSPLQLTESDPLQTIRPYYPMRADTSRIKYTAPTKSPDAESGRVVGRRNPTPPTLHQRQSSSKSSVALPPVVSYGEGLAEDYSDLVVGPGSTFDVSLFLKKVCFTGIPHLGRSSLLVPRKTIPYLRGSSALLTSKVRHSQCSRRKLEAACGASLFKEDSL